MKLKHFLAQERPLVVYSEGATYRPHLGPIAEEYAARGYPVAYVTSEIVDAQEPFISSNIFPFFIGKGVRRTWFFQTVDCDVFLTTMPDLHQLHLKRSIHPVHYVYTQHSLSSLHMVYREGAFDSYDTIFAAGPHHVQEVRALEKIRGTKPKNIVEQGYVHLDDLTRAAKKQVRLAESANVPAGKKTVLVAPSWGSQGLIENHGESTVRSLLDSGFHVIFRPHPRTIQLSPRTVSVVTNAFSGNFWFEFDSAPSPMSAYQRSDVLVTSWSGAAFEYAIAFGKPFVHVDVPRKVRNPNYREVPLEPFEVEHRGSFGESVPEEVVPELGSYLSKFLENVEHAPKKSRHGKRPGIFSADEGARVAADYLEEVQLSRSSHHRKAP